MRFLQFINEAVVNVDMNEINEKIKNLKKHPRMKNTINSFIYHLNDVFSDNNIEFEWSYSPAKIGGIVGGEAGYRDNIFIIKVLLNRDAFIICKKNFAEFALELSSTIEHELIHKAQYKNIPANIRQSVRSTPKDNKWTEETYKAYLGTPQELMAYANTIVRDFQKLGYESDEILEILRRVNEYDPNDLPPKLVQYLDYFKENPTTLKNFIVMYMTI